jgi:hypothetical protein
LLAVLDLWTAASHKDRPIFMRSSSAVSVNTVTISPSFTPQAVFDDVVGSKGERRLFCFHGKIRKDAHEQNAIKSYILNFWRIGLCAFS